MNGMGTALHAPVDFLLQKRYPCTDAMRYSIRCCVLTSVAVGFLWLFIMFKVPSEIEYDQSMMAVKGQPGKAPGLTLFFSCLLWLVPQDSYGRKKDPRPLESWQDLTSKYMKKMKQRRRTWLTVGISSVPGSHESSLAYTLVSLFRATSKVEQKRLTVLIHLADSDLTWLSKTIAQISSLFRPQILAGQLVLIHAPNDAYPVGSDDSDEAYRWDDYSKQNIDHAFLMSFATNLSDYFLLLEDNVFCAQNFISHIQWKVNTMSSDPWVLLEFSNMGFLGKLFHSRDLPLLARFLLLFHKEKPFDRLLPHFRTLLAQKKPILCRPFLFYQRIPYCNANKSHVVRAVGNKGPHSPNNPPGAVFTDMKVFDVHFPWQAYTLDESFFWTHNVSAGNHLTVILNHPVNLNRLQVLTGTILDGKYALEKGQMELGYDPEGMPQYCTSFISVGQLVEGQMDQKVFLKSMGYSVSCVRLVVNADQAGGLIIRHIYLWEESAKSIKATQNGKEIGEGMRN
ncbi:alpha-1,3-mannosyl-glycoprotein 4-beta-N-acetylglucosaminyltransferase-like protein MGAT4E [Saccopteryx leptura]|uniref:alpha-1,3-mannosyl-glycoprotein 4-beta-N-acetylglucosaminyltransferase-like protein MGAT4E n=1 Tax=Saccopteryx leptura TaxID=249018 RepID=UPI00339C964E